MTTRRLATALSVAACAAGLAACGNKQETVTVGHTEGIYVDVDEIKYQVQVSRQLNPEAIPEDETFVSGVSGADARLRRGETWFAVFVRLENESEDPQPVASDYVITDSEGKTYRPVALAETNPFRYHTGRVPGKAVLPEDDSVASQTSINGMELLFKVSYAALDENRPLRLRIQSPTDAKASSVVELDI